jgi:hypothetical protein
MLSMDMARKSAGLTALLLAARAENAKKQEQRLDIAKLAAFGRYCGSGFGTERRRIAAQAPAVDRSRASSASPHLAKNDRKPVALSAPIGAKIKVLPAGIESDSSMAWLKHRF